jgi:hypothetical protein
VGCFGRFLTFRTRNGRVFHILHAAKVCITGISLFHRQKMINTAIFFYIRHNNVWVNLGIINSILRVFVLQIDCNIPRALILIPSSSSSYLFLHPKCPCCNLRLQKCTNLSSTLGPRNFVLARSYCTKIWETFVSQKLELGLGRKRWTLYSV